MAQPCSYSLVVNVPVPEPNVQHNGISRFHYGLKNESKHPFITGKGIGVALIRKADRFVIPIGPKVKFLVVQHMYILDDF